MLDDVQWGNSSLLMYCDNDMEFEEDEYDYVKIIEHITNNEEILGYMPMEALKLFDDFIVCACAGTRKEESNHVEVVSEQKHNIVALDFEANFE
jgi:hypothetical protein